MNALSELAFGLTATMLNLLDAMNARLFPCSADPRALPSFPTRRSSDLTSPSPGSPTPSSGRRRGGPRAPARCRVFGRMTRSEEHTSELQSHSDLVCRLLLEKKKQDNKHLVCIFESPDGLLLARAERFCF